MPGEIHLAECLSFLEGQPDEHFALIYLDPPFNTGRRQSLKRLKTTKDPSGERTGFGGARYRTTSGDEKGYDDVHEDYLAFLAPRLEAARRVLAADGSLFVHLDDREVHYVKVMLDEIFGRACFMNEIIWAYDYGARSKSRWSRKHDVILWYVKDPKNHCFDFEAMDRIPYMAPGLVSEEKRARGKTPTDVWWHTIVSPTGKERTGYPNQKPLGILERIVKVHSRPGDLCLDFFAGSGSFGEACARNGRAFVLVDQNPEAVEVMQERLADVLSAGAR